MDAFHSQKAIGHGTARISGGSHQHIHLLPAFLADKVAQQTGHKPSAHILKGKRGTVEKLQ